MKPFDIKKIAEKRQKKRLDAQVYKTDESLDKPKYYVLEMFPYPSGSGLHTGHGRVFTAGDVLARKKKLEGFNILHVMGYDAFGLPTEQFAMKNKIHPAKATEQNIGNFRKQLSNMGFHLDRDRSVATSDPKFYKWTQRTFLQMYEHYYDRQEQKAKRIKDLQEILETYREKESVDTDNQHEIDTLKKYLKHNTISREEYLEDKKEQTKYIDSRRLAFLDNVAINRCPSCKTALANEDLEGGNCERCDSIVEKRKMKQWMIRITEYAERLLDDLDLLPEWQQSIKEIQRNWIGKSEGTAMNMHIAQTAANSDTLIKIQTRQGREYIEDKVAHHHYQDQNELTEDGFVELVGAVMQNEKGEYLMMHNKKYNRFVAPGGKVGNDETHRHALQTKLKQKLGVECIVGDFIGSVKQMHGGKRSLINFYKCTTSEEIQNLDENNFSGYEWVQVEDLVVPTLPTKQEREEGAVCKVEPITFSVKVKNTITTDMSDIHKTFGSLFLLLSVIKHPMVNVNLISNAPYNLPTYIDPDKHYVTYYCTERDEYLVVPEGQLPMTESEQTFSIYTTRIDTVYGMSYVALSPEHPLVNQITSKEQKKHVEAYKKQAAQKSDLQRTDLEKDKTGVFSGSYAINPFTKQPVPIWIADYVLMDYGTGAVMAVPAHDERDRSFAQKYDLPIVQSIAPYFHVDKGDDAVRVDKELERRFNMHVILKNPKNDTYCCLDREKYGRKTMVTGGIEKGENIKDAAQRKILEETGYSNIQFVKKIGREQHGASRAPHKEVNRYSVHYGLVFELIDETQQEVAPQERARHTTKWFKKDEIENFLNCANELYLRRHYIRDLHAHTEKGVVINSGDYSYMKSDEAIEQMQNWLQATNRGKKQTNYRMQDRCFSRQRYRGEPFPMIHHPDGSIITMDSKELPLTLPDVTHYEPTGTAEGPLAAIDEWINVTLPDGTQAKRESNTMPGWAGSSWYWLRYMDPHNDKEIFDHKKERYRGQVDCYIGGMEHAARHLIYARYWHKFLYDIKRVTTKEPFKRLETVGIVLAEDGRKMSKRRGNVINPDHVIEEFGSDTFRCYEMFMAPFGQEVARSTNAVKGVKRFLDKFIKLGEKTNSNYQDSSEILSLVHQTIKKVTEDIDTFKFNTAISQLMIVTNALTKEETISENILKDLVMIIAPFAPHLAEEMREQLGGSSMVFADGKWPTYDPELIIADSVTLPIQINGKVRGKIEVSPEATQEEVLTIARKDEKIASYIPDPIKKIVYVPGRIMNMVG